MVKRKKMYSKWEEIRKKVDVGEEVDIELIPKDFGRIAAQTAKQVIIQKKIFQ